MLEENLQLFRAENKMNEEVWPEYILFCDDIVHKNLLHTVGVSIAYLADNMDPANNFPALFESRLELLIPNMIFVPSLDPNDQHSFNHLLINLVNGKKTFLDKSLIELYLCFSDIIYMSSLIPRLHKDAQKSYEDLISNETDIKEMKQEILLSVDKALEEATQFCRDFERYSYLWLEDREYCMELFLDYGRILGLFLIQTSF